MVNSPPTKLWHKWAYRISFFILGSGIIWLTGKQYYDSENIQSQNSITISNLTYKITGISSNQSILSEQHQILLNELATNQLINPDFRQSLIESDRKFQDLSLQTDDLNDWMKSLKGKFREKVASVKIQHDKDSKKNQADYQKGFQYFDHTLNSLTNMLWKIATLKGDKIESDFHGLPLTINSDELPLKIAEIKLKKTPSWDFKITWHSDGALRIADDGSQLCINCSGGCELAIPDLPNEVFGVSTDNYKQSIDEHLKVLIAYQDYKLSNTNK